MSLLCVVVARCHRHCVFLGQQPQQLRSGTFTFEAFFQPLSVLPGPSPAQQPGAMWLLRGPSSSSVEVASCKPHQPQEVEMLGLFATHTRLAFSELRRAVEARHCLGAIQVPCKSAQRQLGLQTAYSIPVWLSPIALLASFALRKNRLQLQQAAQWQIEESSGSCSMEVLSFLGRLLASRMVVKRPFLIS